MASLLKNLNLKQARDCRCPACLASGPHSSPLRRALAHNPGLKLLGFIEPGAAADVTALAQHGAPDAPDLRAAIDVARNASTSKNVTGWREDQKPASSNPPRPAGSPFTDKLARDTYGVERLVDSPTTDGLVAAIKKARS